ETSGMAVGVGAAAALAGVGREIAVGVAAGRGAVRALDVAEAFRWRQTAALHGMVDALAAAGQPAAAGGRAGAGRAAAALAVIRILWLQRGQPRREMADLSLGACRRCAGLQIEAARRHAESELRVAVG